MSREQLNWAFTVLLVVIATFGVALGIRMSGGAARTSTVGVLASQTPLKRAMKEMDEAQERIREALEPLDYDRPVRADIARDAYTIARSAEDAINEMPAQGDPRKNPIWRKRLELIDDAQDLAAIARNDNADFRKMPPVFKSITGKCTRCHEVFRPQADDPVSRGRSGG